MSRWCAVVIEKPISFSPWKIGTQKPMSGACEAPLYGSLWMITSPGRNVSPRASNSRMMPRT